MLDGTHPTSLIDYSAVLSLTLVDSKGRILVGVRNPEHNTTHPGVVSTPTMRVPEKGGLLAFNTADLASFTETTPIYRGRFSNFPQQIGETFEISTDSRLGMLEKGLMFGFEDECPLKRTLYSELGERLYWVENLLCEKLGIQSGMGFKYNTFPTSLVFGTVIKDDMAILEDGKLSLDTGDGNIIFEKLDQLKPRFPGIDFGSSENESIVVENLLMLNMLTVTQTPELIAKSNPHYSHLEWITKEDYLKMVEDRSIAHLPEPLNNAFYCAQGLCLIGGYLTLQRLRQEYN